jgi:phosphate transport system ATP-binding protein
MTGPDSTTPSITIRGLTIHAQGRPVLQDVSLDFAAGRTHVVVGPSGSGKTTLLRAINRLNELYPGYRVRGEVVVPWRGEGAPTRAVYRDAYPVEELRRRVGMVFQNPNVLPVTIRENFLVPLRATHGLDRPAMDARMLEALGEVQLLAEVHDRLDEPATRLSGGQQQRLCLARALALRPTALLLDEPTANLDFRATTHIENLIAELKTRYILVVVSHSLAQTARIADRVVLLQDGRVPVDEAVASRDEANALMEQVRRI